jgi:hypothetical protein
MIRPQPSDDFEQTDFYIAGGEILLDVNGDIGFKEIELDGCITPATSREYEITLKEIMDMAVNNPQHKRKKKKSHKNHIDEDFNLDMVAEFDDDEEANFLNNELEKIKFQDDDLDVYIVEAREVVMASEGD